MADFTGIIDIYEGNDSFTIKDAWNRGVRAVLHETSRGTYEKDSLYKQRKAEALQMGMLWGGFHLLSAEDPKTQLDNFLSMEDGSDPRVAMAFDWESTSKGTASVEQVRTFIKLYNAAMKPRYADRYPLLYGGYIIRENADIAAGDPLIGKCPLWYQRYSNEGPTRIPANTWATYTLWQFASEERGYSAPPVTVLPGADYNSFKGTEDQLRQQWPFL